MHSKSIFQFLLLGTLSLVFSSCGGLIESSPEVSPQSPPILEEIKQTQIKYDQWTGENTKILLDLAQELCLPEKAGTVSVETMSPGDFSPEALAEFNQRALEAMEARQSVMPRLPAELFGTNPPSGMGETEDEILIGDSVISKQDFDRVIPAVEQFYLGAPQDSRGLYHSTASRWPFGVIEVFFHGSINPTEKQFIRSMMSEWQAAAGGKIRFSESADPAWEEAWWLAGTSHKTRIRKTNNPAETNGTKGKTHIGRAAWGEMILMEQSPTANWALDRHTVLHEIGHMLGLFHEHQRPDRDSYIRVKYSGMGWDKMTTKWSGFWFFGWIAFTTETTHPMGAFDYKSIMMYPNDMGYYTDRNGNYIETSGDTLTPTDKLSIRSIY